jgi:group I intron endonuclease
MDTTRIESICDKILDNPTERYCEIYKITNIKNNKIYVGQCVSHILNHKRYRPYGHKKRFNTHVSEAFSQKKNQSYYLNNAIKKHGIENFMVEILEYCELNKSDDRELYYITNLNSLFPNGYNLKNGGSVFIHTDESKKKVSDGVVNYYKDKKFDKFKNIKYIDDDIEQYIKPLRKHNEQYGWYVYINRIKTDFGGVHISLEESKQKAKEFISILKTRLAT